MKNNEKVIKEYTRHAVAHAQYQGKTMVAAELHIAAAFWRPSSAKKCKVWEVCHVGATWGTTWGPRTALAVVSYPLS